MLRPVEALQRRRPTAMTDYSLSWTCADCGTQNNRPLTKIEAAFCEALKIFRTLRCRQCGGGKVKSCGNSLPDASDPEVLQAWLSNKKLYFLQQDEDRKSTRLNSSH